MRSSFMIPICLMLVFTAHGWRFPEPTTLNNFKNPILGKSRFSWEWTGPEGGMVEQVMVDPVDPEKAYTVTLMDIWTTSDGANWKLIDEFKYQGGNKKVVSVGEDEAIAAVEDGLWYTPNGGVSWSRLFGFDQFVCMSETPGETVMVVYESDTLELAATLDGGFTWDTLNTLPYDWIYTITFSPGTDSMIFLGAEYHDTVLIIRSTDRGETWQTVWKEDTLDISGMSDMEINPWNTDEIFVSIGMESDGPTGLLYSTDGGASWDWLRSSQTYDVLFPMDVEFKNENTIFVANQMPGGIFEGGRVPGPEEWIFTSSYSQTGATSIEIFNPDSIWAATVAGVIKSIDGGVVWREVNSGLKAVAPFFWFGDIDNTVSRIGVNTMYVGGGFGNPIYKTEDGGQTWSKNFVPDLIFSISVETYRAAPDTTYVGGLGVSRASKQYMFHSLYRTTDGGENWVSLDTLITHSPDSLPYYTSLWISPTNSLTLLAAVNEGTLLRSTDGGDNWNTLFTFLQYPPVGTDTVFIQEANYIRVSHNSGENWDPLLLVTDSVQVMSYNPLSGYLFAVWGDSLYRVTLSAEVTPLISIPPSYWYLSLDAEISSKLFLSYHDFGAFISYFFRSFDYGENFETDTLDFLPGILRAGANEVIIGDLGKSFWRSEDAFTRIYERPAMLRGMNFKVFPTPFSNRLTMQLILERDAFADVALYDLTGRKVDTIVRNIFSMGSHRFEYDAGRLSQGVYFYKARIGGKSYQGKLVKISP